MYHTIKQTFVLVLLNQIGQLHWRVSGAKIVFLGYPTYSHVIGPTKVAKFLQDQGHNVAVATPPQLQARLEDVDVKLLVYRGLGDFSEENTFVDSILRNYFANGSKAKIATDAAAPLKSVTFKMIKDVKLFEDIKNFNPHLMIVDCTPIGTTLAYIPYKLDIPFLCIGAFNIQQNARNPILPSVLPNTMFPIVSYTDRMSFPQRLVNTILELLTFWYDPLINSTLVDEYLVGKPYISIQDLLPKAQLWITQQHSVFDFNPPTTPNVKHVGTLRSFTPEPLPPEFKTFMESASNGVVVVSFGSVLRGIPFQVMDKLLQAFKHTNYKYILQVSSASQQNSSDQFMFKAWIPQFDLLSHEKAKLLITHCGFSSVQEAVLAGVPIIGFPIYADQPQTAAKFVGKGFGLQLDLRSVSVEELVNTIEEITTTPSYKTKVKKASAILKSERVPPVEEAAFWINHILEFGGEHLRSYAQDVPLWKYLCLDIIAFYLLLLHVIVYLFVRLLRFFICCLFFDRKQKHKKE
jgi:UDP:flavonoid glycosyltransferase YjiC (YdhE family)